jgi:hypothetical protein
MIHGAFCLYDVDPAANLWTPASGWIENTLAPTWASILVRSAFQADLSGAINAMYIEFENVPEPAIPAPDPADGLEYYRSLAGSPTRDYLRVPLLSPPLVSVAAGYEDLVPATAGNAVLVRALTAGGAGVTGKAFSAAAGSVVCGAALVAAPAWDDPSRDLLFARQYYGPGDQRTKVATLEVGVGYAWAPEPLG